MSGLRAGYLLRLSMPISGDVTPEAFASLFESTPVSIMSLDASCTWSGTQSRDDLDRGQAIDTLRQDSP